MRKWLIVLSLVLLMVLAGGWYWFRAKGPTGDYRTAKVARGDLVAYISATGTLEPQEVVDVGAQIAGRIENFGPDPLHPNKLIDYRSEVDEGTVLAHIDSVLYVADVAAAQASVDSAKANIVRAQADLGQLQAKLTQTENDWKRAQQAGANAGLSQSDLDSYRAAFESAQANLAVGRAAIVQAQTGQALAEAQAQRAMRNLSYCTIKSPVKGTIIDRRVNIGQTVVAALNAPSLFLIAKDLNRMQVWASVNEADIGRIHSGQLATFTVDAFPGRVFQATVGKVRLNASMTQNVVTYTVEIDTDNPGGILLPYLTANVQFQLDKRQAVLIVPTAALRWTPQVRQVSPDIRAAQDAGGDAPAESASRPAASQPADGSSPQRGFVYVKDGIYVRPVPVRIGVTDGVNSEIESRSLKEGDEIIIGERAPDTSASSGATNPFLPQMGKGTRKAG